MKQQVAAFRLCEAKGHTAEQCVLYFESLGVDEEKVYFHCDQVRGRNVVDLN